MYRRVPILRRVMSPLDYLQSSKSQSDHCNQDSGLNLMKMMLARASSELAPREAIDSDVAQKLCCDAILSESTPAATELIRAPRGLLYLAMEL